jgi:O-antigen/teichoic acid export membrane protein
LLTILVAFYFLIKLGFKPMIDVDRGYLAETFRFSLGNYIVSIFILAPGYILPIVVNNGLGAVQAAHYIIGYSIGRFFIMIPIAISTSLFVECSRGADLKRATIKSLFLDLSILTLAVIVLYLSVNKLFELIGRAPYEYIDTLELLNLFILLSYFVIVTSIYSSIKRVQKDTRSLVFMFGLIFALVIGLSQLLMREFGLVGVGYAWLIGYGVGIILMGIDIWRDGFAAKLLNSQT